jgi:hypothetical protein
MTIIKKFTDFLNEDGSTTANIGSGIAVAGGATGNFASANGTSVNGGDSGTAFSTNSNGNGMGAIRSPQPSSTPGQVWGGDGKDGSGDIGAVLNGTYGKQAAYKRGNNLKRTKKQKDAISKLNNLYVVKFNDFGVNVKENAYIAPKTIKCQECGEEVEDDLNILLGHVRNKHWGQPNERFVDTEPRELLKRFFHEIPKK